mgnify:CR=1 FL=1
MFLLLINICILAQYDWLSDETSIRVSCKVLLVMYTCRYESDINGLVAFEIFTTPASISMEVSLFAYWLWSCVVTVLILLTKYWPPLVVKYVKLLFENRRFPWACSTSFKHGRGISQPSRLVHPTSRHPTPPHYTLSHPRSQYTKSKSTILSLVTTLTY